MRGMSSAITSGIAIAIASDSSGHGCYPRRCGSPWRRCRVTQTPRLTMSKQIKPGLPVSNTGIKAGKAGGKGG